jgi:hypothetical protein
MILIDTREQKYSHISEYFDAHGVKYDRSKLYVGDYTLSTDQRICIDRKHNMAEVYGNVIQQHERFRNELIRGRDGGHQIIVLVEDPRITKLDEVESWKNPRFFAWMKSRGRIPKPADSETVMKIMQRMEERYSVEWRFCRKEETARTILDILGERYEEGQS